MDNAEAGFSPLGVPENAIALDIDPADHGRQRSDPFRADLSAGHRRLNNALVAFDDAKDVTRLMRSEQDSLAGLQNRVAEQELAYRNALIELYGTPYPDDTGPGKTWTQDYDGPDVVHYMYVETPELPFDSLWNYPGRDSSEGTMTISLGAIFPATGVSDYFLTGLDVFEEVVRIIDADRVVHFSGRSPWLLRETGGLGQSARLAGQDTAGYFRRDRGPQ